VTTVRRARRGKKSVSQLIHHGQKITLIINLAWHVAPMRDMRNTYKILVGKPEWKRLFRRPSRRLKDNIRMRPGKLGGRIWIGLIWLRIGTSGELL